MVRVWHYSLRFGTRVWGSGGQRVKDFKASGGCKPQVFGSDLLGFKTESGRSCRKPGTTQHPLP